MQVKKEKILIMCAEGKTQREIAEHFGFKDKYVVKEYLKRERRKERAQSYGILPRRRGRPPKGYPSTENEKDNEIKRLTMENELLRDFLHIAGRK
jgi:hypothetical protein